MMRFTVDARAFSDAMSKVSNLRYMIDALRQFRKEPMVRLKLSGPYTPIVVEAEGRSDFALVLPVRLRDEMAA